MLSGCRIAISGLLLMFSWNLPAAETALGAGMVNPGYHEQPVWFKQSFLDLREDVAEAHADGKRLMLYFYQDGCPYCQKLLETNFALRDITDKTRATLDVVSINMWGDREVTDLQGKVRTEKQFAQEWKVMFTPTLLFLNEQGELILRVNGYYAPHKFNAVLDYVGGHRETELSFRDYYAGLSPPSAKGVLHDDPAYLRPPYRLASRVGQKPLLVFFEQKDCAVCDELHTDILQREASQALLQQFDVALLDMWSGEPLEWPDGTRGSARDLARNLGVQYAPTLVMFDIQGNEVFRTEAYLKSFHIQSALEYVASGAYRDQPSFQRFVQGRADALEARGVHVNLMD